MEDKSPFMSELWLSLTDLPEQGQEYHISDQSLWLDPLREFDLQAELSGPLNAELLLVPSGNGVLARGSLQGQIRIPCDRCTQDVRIDLEASFELFEAYPAAPEPSGEASELIRINQGHPELNAGELLWEQFLLALPVKPLCAESCRGLCPKCGRNLNLDPCACDPEDSDPRMALFKNLKIEP